MITSINPSNVRAYAKYFKEVTEYLQTHNENGDSLYTWDVDEKSGDSIWRPLTEEELAEKGITVGPLMDPETSINSLEDVFRWMHELRLYKPNFTILPLDEDAFEIDLDTRTITVPPHFVKNGISVKGDQIAESVYFRCRRFYDHMDLATQNIYIQYTNAEGESRVSVPAVVDIESQPGYIIFEWAISEAVTAAAGNVSFAVRFYSHDSALTSLYYSLSTLTQTVKINNGLDFDITSQSSSQVEEDDNKVLMENRLTDKILYGENISIAEAPQFFTDLSLGDTMNLGLKDGFTSEPVEVPVEAYTSDGGQISYRWDKYSLGSYEYLDENGEIKENTEREKTALPISFAQDMVLTKDEVPVTNKIYYVKKANSVSGYEIAVFSGDVFPVDPETGNAIEYFERQSIGVINSVGYYAAIAQNRVGNSKVSGYTPGLKDNEILFLKVPAASEFEDSVDIATSAVIDFTTKEVPGEEGEESIVKKVCTLKIVNLTDSPDNDNGGKLTYKWYRLGLKDTEFKLLENNTENVLEIVVENDEDYDYTNLIGQYKVELMNHLNNTVTYKASNECRVTQPASAPIVYVDSSTSSYIYGARYEGDEEAIVYTAKNLDYAQDYGFSVMASAVDTEVRTADDEITYQWYKYRVGRYDLPDDILKSIKEAYVGEYWDDYEGQSTADIKIEGATDKVFKGTKENPILTDSLYYCIVSNKYNGQVERKSSPFFTVLTSSNIDSVVKDEEETE